MLLKVAEGGMDFLELLCGLILLDCSIVEYNTGNIDHNKGNI